MKHIMTAAVAALALAGTAQAQSVEDEREIARQMVALSGEADIALEAILEMLPMIELSIRQAYPDLTSRQYLQITDVYREEFSNSRDALEAAFVDAYVDAYSYEDLSGLLAFYRSDLGSRYLAGLPTVQSAAGDAGERVGIEVERRAAPQIAAIIRGDTATSGGPK